MGTREPAKNRKKYPLWGFQYYPMEGGTGILGMGLPEQPPAPTMTSGLFPGEWPHTPYESPQNDLMYRFQMYPPFSLENPGPVQASYGLPGGVQGLPGPANQSFMPWETYSGPDPVRNMAGVQAVGGQEAMLPALGTTPSPGPGAFPQGGPPGISNQALADAQQFSQYPQQGVQLDRPYMPLLSSVEREQYPPGGYDVSQPEDVPRGLEHLLSGDSWRAYAELIAMGLLPSPASAPRGVGYQTARGIGANVDAGKALAHTPPEALGAIAGKLPGMPSGLMQGFGLLKNYGPQVLELAQRFDPNRLEFRPPEQSNLLEPIDRNALAASRGHNPAGAPTDVSDPSSPGPVPGAQPERPATETAPDEAQALATGRDLATSALGGGPQPGSQPAPGPPAPQAAPAPQPQPQPQPGLLSQPGTGWSAMQGPYQPQPQPMQPEPQWEEVQGPYSQGPIGRLAAYLKAQQAGSAALAGASFVQAMQQGNVGPALEYAKGQQGMRHKQAQLMEQAKYRQELQKYRLEQEERRKSQQYEDSLLKLGDRAAKAGVALEDVLATFDTDNPEIPSVQRELSKHIGWANKRKEIKGEMWKLVEKGLLGPDTSAEDLVGGYPGPDKEQLVNEIGTLLRSSGPALDVMRRLAEEQVKLTAAKQKAQDPELKAQFNEQLLFGNMYRDAFKSVLGLEEASWNRPKISSLWDQLAYEYSTKRDAIGKGSQTMTSGNNPLGDIEF